MSSEDYEIFRVLRAEASAEGEERRKRAGDVFLQARSLASRAGLVLARHSDVHYSLRHPDGWIFNIYPGNRRLYYDKNRKKGPFIKLPDNWTLMDVVKEAVKQAGLNGLAEEVHNNAVEEMKESRPVCREDVEKRAYFLWIEAGRPVGDGADFWYRAERELKGDEEKQNGEEL